MTRPDDYSKIRVLLIEGRARQIMPLMESMHRLGCHVATFNTSRLDMGYASRFPDEKLLVPCDMDDPDAYWNAVGPILRSGRFDIAIPMFDFSAEILARHKAELRDTIHLAVNDWDVFQFARDKLKTMRVCMENDLNRFCFSGLFILFSFSSNFAAAPGHNIITSRTVIF